MLRPITLLALLVVLGVLGNNCSNSENSAQAKATNPEKNYEEFCSSCHGEKMDAFVDRDWKHGKNDSDLFKSIKHGYANEGMPSFDSAFTDNEISDLTKYLIKGIENVERFWFKDSIRSNVFSSEGLTVKLDTVIKGIDVPWSMAFLPNGEMLVTERGGKLYRVSSGRKLQEISGVPPVIAEGQGGLLDVILHPDFKNNSTIYLSFSKGTRENKKLSATTAIVKARLEGNSLKNVQEIFEALPYSELQYHYGGRMVFGNDGYLYFSVGDRGKENENPQSLKSQGGKMHRIKEDGSIPSDNPYVNNTNAAPSVYSYGHRNPQGVTKNPKTGEIWTHEHGPRGGDEINISQKGKNYGWPVICFGINYNGKILTKDTAKEGMEQPLLYWLPSIGPSGIAFVEGDRYPAWKNDLLVGSLRYRYLERVQLNGTKVEKQEFLVKDIGRVRDVRMGPDGYIYVAVELPGAIFRLIPQ